MVGLCNTAGRVIGVTANAKSTGRAILILGAAIVAVTGRNEWLAGLASALLFAGGIALAWVGQKSGKSNSLKGSNLLMPMGEKTKAWLPAYKVSWFVLIGGLMSAALFTNLAVYWHGFRVLGIICFIPACAALIPLGVYTYYMAYEGPPIWPQR